VIMPPICGKALKSKMVTEYDFDSLPINTKYIGVLQNKWIVYISGHLTNKILVGYRGTHYVDAPCIYCPHLLLCNAEKTSDKKGYGSRSEEWMLHRRGRHIVAREDYLACIEVKNKESMLEF
jgi:hypothetical protein